MSGLNLSMSIALSALSAEQGALDATSNNIANVNTPGYSRQIPIFTEAPTISGKVPYGTGVTLQQFQSVRDQLLQLRIYEDTQQQGSAQAQVDTLSQVEQVFSSATGGIGGAFSTFFDSLSQLSTDPTNAANRQQVLSAANSLANAFHQSSSALTGIQSNLDKAVPQMVEQVNQLTQQIATLNGEVSQSQATGQDPGAIQDQRDQLITQLSGIIGVQVTQTETGLTLTTANGVPLVVGNHNYTLQAGVGASGVQDVFSQGQDITSSIQGGSLAGTIQVRDQMIASLQSGLDNLASEFAAAFNTANQAGFDLNGNAGQSVFNAVSGPGAAANFGVAITDPSLIAASSDGSPGSSGNIANLLAVRDQALPSGASPLDTYSNLVLQVGNFSANAQEDSAATSLSLQQLTNQRDAISGVSIDEESVNMIRYQQAYSAAARIVSTVDQMTQTLLSMVNG